MSFQKVNREFGRRGEELAGEYLKEKGYQIIRYNFQIWGGEIDIISRDKSSDEIVFVEVKTRKDESWMELDEVITYKKKRFIRRAGKKFLFFNKLEDQNWRVDFVCILLSGDMIKKLEHFKAVD